MATHIAILKPRFLSMILAGTKTVESRFGKTDRPPFNQVRPGELIHLKQSGGPFVAVAEAGRVWCQQVDDERQQRQVFDRFAQRVGVDESYWPMVAGRPFITMIELKAVQRCDAAPAYKPRNMWAWYTLDDAASPVVSTTLTDGAIRNRYLRLTSASNRPEPGPMSLILPDGREVETELQTNGMVRWRAWGKLFKAAGVEPGWRVRMVPERGRPRWFRVSFVEP